MFSCMGVLNSTAGDRNCDVAWLAIEFSCQALPCQAYEPVALAGLLNIAGAFSSTGNRTVVHSWSAIEFEATKPAALEGLDGAVLVWLALELPL